MAPSKKDNNEIETNGVSVFVRVRPLTPLEQERGFTLLHGLVTTSSTPETAGNAVAFINPSPLSSQIGGFEGVLGPESCNRDIFTKCFQKRLPTVLRGGTASLFCYGYTGGGKTHTVIGYGDERGLFYLAAESLLAKLSELQQSKDDDDDGDNTLFLRATACEIYNDTVWDLIGDEKLACTLRTNATGQLVVQRHGQSEQLAGVKPGGGGGEHATLVTLSQNPRAKHVYNAEDLHEIHRSCVTQRACGNSTTHHESSRSHAILRLEVTNKGVQRAEDRLRLIEAQLPAVRNALDNAKVAASRIRYSGYIRVLRACDKQDASSLGELSPDDYCISDVSDINKICLRDVEDGQVGRTVEEWAERLGESSLQIRYVSILKEYPGGEVEIKAKEIENEQEQRLLEKLLAEKERDLIDATKNYEELLSKGPSVLGGSMLLVDLAGADYDHRTGTEQKESIAINQSLLALKECFRSLSNVSKRRPPFRDSKLTRLLQDSLAPSNTTQRRNKESVSVMLVNVSPAAQLEKGTVNALRYGQMYAIKDGISAIGGDTAVGRTVNHTKQRRRAVDPEVLAAVRKIYEEKAPEKTTKQVETILSKYQGREALLLAKVRAKYLC